MNWNEPKSVEAVRQYVRIFAGLAFLAVLLYMVVVDRLDVQVMVQIIAGLAGVGQIGQAWINRQQSKARDKEIAELQDRWEDIGSWG